MLAASAGALLALGLVILFKGYAPGPPTLREQLQEFEEVGFETDTSTSRLRSLAIHIFRLTRNDADGAIAADLTLTEASVEDHAYEKLKAAAGFGAMAPVFAFVAGFLSSGFAFLVVAATGAVAGYFIPDIELKKKAAERRQEFSTALTAFVTLVAISISGGGGINTALADAAAMGDGWVFALLRRAISDAALQAKSPWLVLEGLGRELNIIELSELSGALMLAGNSGARVTDTLHARAESARSSEISEARSRAEAKSSTLGVPVGLILLAWALFMGYPAIQNMMGGVS